MNRTIVLSAPYEVQLAQPVSAGSTSAVFTERLTLPPYMTGVAGLELRVPRELERFIAMWDLNHSVFVHGFFQTDHPVGETWLFPAQKVEAKPPDLYRLNHPRIDFMPLRLDSDLNPTVIWMDGSQEYLPYYAQRNPTTRSFTFATTGGGVAEITDHDFLLLNRAQSNMLPCSLRENLIRSEQGMRPLTERERWQIDARYGARDEVRLHRR